VVKTPASKSGGPGFRSEPGDRLSWLRFSWFFSASRRILGQYLKIRPWQLPSKSFRVHHLRITLSFDAK